MFDKFDARCKLGNVASAYAWWHYANDHHTRYKKFVESMSPKLICQDCGGAGEHWEDAVDYHNIYLPCGWCEGTGLVTRRIRGEWLRWKQTAKR